MTTNPTTVRLKRRTATVRNFNYQPEKSGEGLEPRCDLNLQLQVTAEECDQFIRTRLKLPSELLWEDKGEPELRDLIGKGLSLKTTASGKLTLGLVSGDFSHTFGVATLKKLRVVPQLDFTAQLHCQVRFDPTGYMDPVGQMRIDGTCMFEFAGEREPEQEQLPMGGDDGAGDDDGDE